MGFCTKIEKWTDKIRESSSWMIASTLSNAKRLPTRPWGRGDGMGREVVGAQKRMSCMEDAAHGAFKLAEPLFGGATARVEEIPWQKRKSPAYSFYCGRVENRVTLVNDEDR